MKSSNKKRLFNFRPFNEKIITLSLSIALLFLVVSCTETKTPAQTIRIGWIGPLTGPVHLLGIDNLDAIKLALTDYHEQKLVNEPNIKIYAEDDQYIAQKTIDAYHRIVKLYKPPVIFVSTYTAMFLLADLALRDGIVLINPIDNDNNLAQLNKNVIFIAKKTESLANVIDNALIKDNKKKVFILYYDGDDFMPLVANLIADRLKKRNVKYLLQSYSVNKSDFSEALLLAKTVATDGLILLGYRELGIAMKQARKLAITSSFYTANIMMRDIAEDAINGTQFFDLTYLDANSEKALALLTRFESRYGRGPILQWSVYQAYDAANILFDILRQPMQERKPKAQQILNRLYSVDNYDGVSGAISVQLDGTSKGITPGLYQIINDSVKKVENDEE